MDAPAAGVGGNGAVGSGVGDGRADGGVGAPEVAIGVGTASRDAVGAFGATVALVKAGEGDAGAPAVGVGAPAVGVGATDGADVGATTTIAVDAGIGAEARSPHAAAISMQAAAGAIARATIRANGVTTWGIGNSSGPQSF